MINIPTHTPLNQNNSGVSAGLHIVEPHFLHPLSYLFTLYLDKIITKIYLFPQNLCVYLPINSPKYKSYNVD